MSMGDNDSKFNIDGMFITICCTLLVPKFLFFVQNYALKYPDPFGVLVAMPIKVQGLNYVFCLVRWLDSGATLCKN